MSIVVNGEERTVDEGTTVADLVRELGRNPDRPGVAVAIGGEVVPRSEWTRPLRDGERVEVVGAVQGGAW
jgi:sulfur carrier protein